LFIITYIFSTGILSFSTIIYNNQALFNSIDHLTSAFIHTLPLVATWAIRWKHIIYSNASNGLKSMGLDILDLTQTSFSTMTDFSKFIYLPLLFWFVWALIYFTLTKTVLSKYVRQSDKYGSGIGDFVREKKYKAILGDHAKYSHLKYIIQHLIFFFLVLPLSCALYFNFTCNTIFVISIIAYLGWNTERNDKKTKKKKQDKLIEEENKEVSKTSKQRFD
jgi:hypothetical protein